MPHKGMVTSNPAILDTTVSSILTNLIMNVLDDSRIISCADWTSYPVFDRKFCNMLMAQALWHQPSFELNTGDEFLRI